jgi:hypothetical protein
MRRWKLIVLINLFLIGSILAAFELGIELLLTRPDLAPPFLHRGLRSVYIREDWQSYQGDLERVRYDPEVTYLLRPGTVSFSNREFDDQYQANSAGLRDDDESLVAPDVICLGDSCTMGWGVGQEETFPQVLERRTSLKVLNAGVSSYGQARSVLLLRRLDRSNLRAVVVQYFFNDYQENQSFLEAGGQLSITPESEWNQALAEQKARGGYRPLAYLRAFLNRQPFFPELLNTTVTDVAGTFLSVLLTAQELRGVPILFLEIGAWGKQDDALVEAAADRLSEDCYQSLREQLVPVRLRDKIHPEHAFVLDPHLRAEGHAVVAEQLESALLKKGLLE